MTATGVSLRATIIGRDDSAQVAELEADGLAPTDDRESAIAASLDAGAYTAIVSGKDGTTGDRFGRGLSIYRRRRPKGWRTSYVPPIQHLVLLAGEPRFASELERIRTGLKFRRHCIP